MTRFYQPKADQSVAEILDFRFLWYNGNVLSIMYYVL